MASYQGLKSKVSSVLCRYGLLLLCTLVAVFLIGIVLRVGRMSGSLVRGAKWNPPLGMPFSALGEMRPVNEIRLPSMSKPTLLVYFRTCEGCEIAFLLSWQKLLSYKVWQRELGSLLVVQTDVQSLRDLAKGNRWQVPAVADPDGKIGRLLKTAFSPRVYGFVDGKLVWAQRDPKMSMTDALDAFVTKAFGPEKATDLFNEWASDMRITFWGKGAAEAIAKRRRK